MVPVNELLFRERLDTDPESQVTPNQKHSVPADPNQPVLFVQLAPSVELYNAIKARLSTELILLVDWLPIPAGRPPVIEFCVNVKVAKLAKLPISLGMTPESSLLEILR